MKKLNLFITILFLSSTILFAQNSKRVFEGIKNNKSNLEIKTNDGKYLIKALNDHIIETSFIPQGESYSDKSHAVILTKSIKAKFSENPSYLFYKTNGIQVTIQKSPLQISYSYKNKPIISKKRDISKRIAQKF
jgi:hypothetical protein